MPLWVWPSPGSWRWLVLFPRSSAGPGNGTEHCVWQDLCGVPIQNTEPGGWFQALYNMVWPPKPHLVTFPGRGLRQGRREGQ